MARLLNDGEQKIAESMRRIRNEGTPSEHLRTWEESRRGKRKEQR